MKISILQYILNRLLGRKYYANIINVRGTDRCEITCHIFSTPEEAAQHAQTIASTASFLFIETVTFRSRKSY